MTAAPAQKVSPKTKMPFYATQDMTTYIFTAITEHNESLDKDERRDDKKAIENIVYNNNRARLKELCEEFLSSQFVDTDTPLFAAILNSIHLDNLNDYLMEWFADCDIDEKAEDEAETDTYQQTKDELVAKMAEVKRLINEKNDAYSNIAKIAAEMDALTNGLISRPYNDCSCKSSCACDD